MMPNETKQWIYEIFKNVLESPNVTEETIAKYFSQELVWRVDGKSLGYADFMAHITTLKAVTETIKSTSEHLIVDNDGICSVHIVDVVKKDGSKVKAKVIAFFQVKDQKIILCDELTHIVEGSKSDHDLGSRTT